MLWQDKKKSVSIMAIESLKVSIGPQSNPQGAFWERT